MLAYSPAQEAKWIAEAELHVEFEYVEAFHPAVFLTKHWTIETTQPIAKGTLLHRATPLLRYKSIWQDDRR